MCGLDHFGFAAPWYDRVFRFNRLEKFKQLAALPAAGRLLDIGGGTGRVSVELAPLVDQACLVDISAGMLRQARARPGLHPAQAASEYLPFASGTFERIIMVDAFHHLLDQPASLRELWRVLRPGGRLLVEEPDIRTAGARWIALGEKLLLMRSHFWSPEKIAALLAEQGARPEIHVEGGTAWVTAAKPS